jgi:hypothetical protein
MNPFNSSYKFSRRPHFRSELLPSPKDYYPQYFSHLDIDEEWNMVCCPFHEDHNPSLSLNMEEGNFVCFGCDTTGGDIVAFDMLYHDRCFIESCKALEVWL